ncbi:unnamed protein product [Rotaria sp. Silwood1]|nr:unnamed protein product [Rotaria sp. Silwood1]
MSSFYYLLFFGNILLLCISLTKSIPLDGTCTNSNECDGGNATICENEKCQCDTPWYTPCNAGCSTEFAFVYEGEECRTRDNCFNNSICHTDRRCRCQTGYTPINGLCYKSLNALCSSGNECWSRDCREGVCKCRLGYIPRGDNSRCQKQLARLYSNWAEANASNDFCYDSIEGACLDINAVCKNDSQRAEKFCQCPSDYNPNYQTQECEWKVYSGALSPSTITLPYEECGTCRDENALCAHVGNQTTCWCQAGFINVDNVCRNEHLDFTFPNENDINRHQYILNNCWTNGTNNTQVVYNGLCVCAPGYEFVNARTPCRPIIPKWENDNFEYGVCTRITSNGSPIEEHGLCPSPLSCQPRQDKYVCSCGHNKYWDESNNTCYYFLERDLTSLITSGCPPNSMPNGTQCRCSPDGQYRVSSDKKRCEIRLAIEDFDARCTNNLPFDSTCETLFGTHTKFCTTGECRCVPGRSYYSNGRCVTYLYTIDPTTGGHCPSNAERRNNQCQCNLGYRAAADGNRTCARVSTQLYESIANPPSSIYTDVLTSDCKALYLNGPVRAFNNACMCENGTFISGPTCVFYLSYTPLPTDGTTLYCPPLAIPDPSGQGCMCISGYKNAGDNRTCVRITDRVYEYDAINVINIAGLTVQHCRALFGNAAEVAQNNTYCRCRDPSIAFWDNNRCYFLVETNQAEAAAQQHCPTSSIQNGTICQCPLGYEPIESKRGCVRKAVFSSNLQTIDLNTFTTSCDTRYNDNDCEGLHGIGAVCRNNTCYCNRHLSFVSGDRCELFSQFIFPGQHERYSRTCNIQEDCGIDSDQNGIECGFINNITDNYRVCKCKPDYYFNPIDSRCVKSQCYPECSNTEDCINYKCVCQVGHYRDSSGQCVPITTVLTLHQRCNVTIWNAVTSVNNELICSPTCERAECASGYRDTGLQCVRISFNDYCAYSPDQCIQFSPNSLCYTDDNKCVCNTGYYETDGDRICARSVNGRCVNHEDCGNRGECLKSRCRCRTGAREEEGSDAFGRKIIRCVNGGDQIRFSAISLLIFVFVRLFFI